MKNSREQILKKLRNSVLQKTEKPYPDLKDDEGLFNIQDENPVNILKIELERVGTKCIELSDVESFIDWFEMESKKRKWNQIFCSEPDLLTLFGIREISISKDEKFHEKSVAITYCEAVISRTGSVIISSEKPMYRTYSIASDVHIVIAFQHQVRSDLSDFLNEAANNLMDSSMLSIITGASRTADIEKTLVMGAHGPKELYVVVIG